MKVKSENDNLIIYSDKSWFSIPIEDVQKVVRMSSQYQFFGGGHCVIIVFNKDNCCCGKKGDSVRYAFETEKEAIDFIEAIKEFKPPVNLIPNYEK